VDGLAEAHTNRPRRPADLTEDVRGVFDAWGQCREAELDQALGRVDGFFKPPGRFSSKQKCCDLMLLRSPLPLSITSVTPLSEADVTSLFGRVVTPSERRGDSDGDSVRSSPSEDRMQTIESNLAKYLDTIARQKEQLEHQASTLKRLFKAEADPDEVQTSTYEVADSVLQKLERNAAGKASWLDIKPLPKSKRRRILREHGGTFNAFPPDLDMLASTKALKLVQEANLSLPHFATHEVTQFMARNTGTIKMCGTVLSRIREMRVDIQTPNHDGSDDDASSNGNAPLLPASVPFDMLEEFLTILESAADGAMDLAIDTQTFMRLAVSRRIETALGVAHLQQDPTKRPKEDFMSPKTLTLIEDAAKVREDLTWAMEARKTVTSERPPLFQSRLRKSPGGGQRNQPAAARGQDMGAGVKGSGKGKVKPKKVQWDKTRAEAKPNSAE
jgi:hypothetical protein